MPRAVLDIDSIAAGGDGVGRHEGLVVFVPRTAPGDRAVVNFEIKGRLGRGRLVSLERDGRDRTPSPCPHYVEDDCGGCQLQHLRYDAQRAAKATIVQDALTRIARRAIDRPDVEPSGREWRYRAKLTLALRRRGTRWIGGLHPYHDPVAVFELRDCPITDERVVSVWRAILDSAGPELLPTADRLRGAVRMLEDGAALIVEGGTKWNAPGELIARVPAVSGIWWAPDGRRPRLVARRGDPRLGASFAQVNPEVAARVRARVIERVLSHSPASVVDAYAGSGGTAIPLAERGIAVTAIERDSVAARAAAAALRYPSRSIAAAVEDAIGDALPADVVIVNPPRGGLDARVPGILSAASRKPRAIVYVSCDPATMARDLRRLPSYRIASLRSFDMFPQTAHVETVCELTLEDAA